MYICDLGLAKVHHQMSAISTSNGSGAGTLAYKAPEMFVDSKRSTPVDIYSLGCVMIELFQSKRVWGDLDGLQIMAKVVGKHNVEPQSPPTTDVPDMYKTICKVCTELDTIKRPSAADILEYFMS